MPATPADQLIQNAGCFQCLGMSMADALALAEWDLISQNIAPVVANSILTELGIDLLDETGVALLVE